MYEKAMNEIIFYRPFSNILVMVRKKTVAKYCKFGNFCVTFISRIYYFLLIPESNEYASFVAFMILYSCIDIYAHSCLKAFSIGRKPCSNSKSHVQIMKFTCRLNMGFGRRHWSMRRDVMFFVETKWPTSKKLRGFR